VLYYTTMSICIDYTPKIIGVAV